MRSSYLHTLVLVCLGALGWSVPGQAQTTPPGLMTQSSASTGTTDVAAGGFQAAAAKDAAAKEESELQLSAGGLSASGNSTSTAMTGAGLLRLRRADNQYSANFAANYARSAASADEPSETSVSNIQGRVRYDRYLSDAVSLFVAETGRRDRFQGLTLRLNFDPGVAYYFFDYEKHRLVGELGYDFQYDVRRDETIAEAAAEGINVDKTEVEHSGRAFAGYENKLNQAVSFVTGLEYIQSILEAERWRLNWDVGVTSSIAESFSLAATFSLRYDNSPLPGIEKTDTTTALSLVYTLL